MKLIASGVTASAAINRSPSFSRSSSSTSTTIFPALNSAMISVIGLMAIFFQILSGAVIKLPQALGVARQQVGLEVDPVAGYQLPQVGRLQRVRNQIDPEFDVVHLVDREAHAV